MKIKTDIEPRVGFAVKKMTYQGNVMHAIAFLATAQQLRNAMDAFLTKSYLLDHEQRVARGQKVTYQCNVMPAISFLATAQGLEVSMLDNFADTKRLLFRI